MRRHRLALAAALLLAGCGPARRPTRALPLEARWRPLLAVVEDRGAPPGAAMVTLGPHARVRDLGAWAAAYPAGSAAREAVLTHERAHADRQVNYGGGPDPVGAWVDRYAAEPDFRLQEEQVAYAAQVWVLLDLRAGADVVALARAMSGPAYGGMVSYEAAKVWLEGVVRQHEAGRAR